MSGVIKGPDPTGKLTELERLLLAALDKARAEAFTPATPIGFNTLCRRLGVISGLQAAVAILMDVRGDQDPPDEPLVAGPPTGVDAEGLR